MTDVAIIEEITESSLVLRPETTHEGYAIDYLVEHGIPIRVHPSNLLTTEEKTVMLFSSPLVKRYLGLLSWR